MKIIKSAFDKELEQPVSFSVITVNSVKIRFNDALKISKLIF
jgi:hypothetical protein